MHKSVLLNECIENLNLSLDSIVVDCTLGYGGHSSEILKRIPKGMLYSFDQDMDAIKYSSERLSKIYSNYDLVLELLKEITDNTYKIVVIDEPSFKEEVLNFKNHMNDQSYYTYQEETKDMIIKNQVYKDNNLCYGNLVQKAIDVFGSEYVSVSEKGND